jgi:hypothetical protein
VRDFLTGPKLPTDDPDEILAAMKDAQLHAVTGAHAGGRARHARRHRSLKADDRQDPDGAPSGPDDLAGDEVDAGLRTGRNRVVRVGRID